MNMPTTSVRHDRTTQEDLDKRPDAVGVPVTKMIKCSLCGEQHQDEGLAERCCTRKCSWCGQYVDFDDYAHEFEDCLNWRDSTKRRLK